MIRTKVERDKDHRPPKRVGIKYQRLQSPPLQPYTTKRTTWRHKEGTCDYQDHQALARLTNSKQTKLDQ